MNQIVKPIKHRSLNWTLTTSTVLAVIIAMTVYTLFEILSSGSLSGPEIISHHVLPTIFIGIIIWAVLTCLLRSKVIAPVENILGHLKHIGNGRLAEIDNHAKISEIRDIISGVNSLTDKLKKAPDNEGLSKAIDDLVELRADLKGLIDTDQITPDHLVPVMKDLRRLEGHFLSALVE